MQAIKGLFQPTHTSVLAHKDAKQQRDELWQAREVGAIIGYGPCHASCLGPVTRCLRYAECAFPCCTLLYADQHNGTRLLGVVP